MRIPLRPRRTVVANEIHPVLMHGETVLVQFPVVNRRVETVVQRGERGLRWLDVSGEAYQRGLSFWIVVHIE